MRGFAGQSKQLSPHPPLRGTFSRGEKVGSPRPFLIAVCNARANRANESLVRPVESHDRSDGDSSQPLAASSAEDCLSGPDDSVNLHWHYEIPSCMMGHGAKETTGFIGEESSRQLG